MKSPSIGLIIPTFNAEKDIPVLFNSIFSQSLKPNIILVIDSSSKDKTISLLQKFDVKIHIIPQKEFDHGGTRRLATTLIDVDIYLFMTQDVVLVNNEVFKNLIENLLTNEKIGCVYARQLPKENANPLSVHGRLFNYPAKNYIRAYDDRKQYGIKTCFNSDNLAAYRKNILNEVGGFPPHFLTGEDAYLAAKILKKGYFVAYASNALIYHSHNLSLRQEFHRYFSVGVFHQRERWILKEFSRADSEGLRFIKSEFLFLLKHKKIHWIPKAFFSTLVKYFAYKLGLYENKIPFRFKKNWGVNKMFWVNDCS